MNRRLAWTVGLALLIAAVVTAILLKSPAEHPLEAARRLYREGKYADAVVLFRLSLKERREDLDAHREYQNAMRKLGQPESIPPEYEAVLVRNPQAPWAHYLRARVGTPERFDDGMKKALELDPNFVPARRALAHMAVDDKRYEDALKHFDLFIHKDAEENDLPRYARVCYMTQKFESLDKVLGRMIDEPLPPGMTLVAVPLAQYGKLSVALLVAQAPAEIPFTWGIRFIKDEKNYRMIAVSKKAEGAAVSWTKEWELVEQDIVKSWPKFTEIEKRKDRPTFKQLHDIATGLLGTDEEKK